MLDAKDRVIVEGVMTTLSPEGVLNIAPMGPVVDASFERFTFRPFATSRTYRNMAATGHGVFHVTDDVLLIARGAMGTIGEHELPVTKTATAVNGRVLVDACRCFEMQVTSIDDSKERVVIEARPVAVQRLRDFFGFNRAKHAVIEAAILATRLHLTGSGVVMQQYVHFQLLVDKTGGPAEQQAMHELSQFVQAYRERETS